MTFRRAAAALAVVGIASTGASRTLFASRKDELRPAMAFSAAAGLAADPTSAPVFKDPALDRILGDYQGSATHSYPAAAVVCGQFVNAAGEPFVAFHLLVPHSRALAAGQAVTFFGAIHDEAGRTVRTFEENAALGESKGGLFAERSLSLPAGKARAYLGVASNGQALAVGTTDLIVTATTGREAPSVSTLILSNDVHPLSGVTRDDEPFVFEGIKVVPKADRTFRSSDELWYFFELRNPGLDPVSNGPRIQVKLEVIGKGTDGTPATRTSLPREVQPLKGTAERYGFGSSMPLAMFSPGDYTLKVRINDTVRKSTNNLQENFKIVGEGNQ